MPLPICFFATMPPSTRYLVGRVPFSRVVVVVFRLIAKPTVTGPYYSFGSRYLLVNSKNCPLAFGIPVLGPKPVNALAPGRTPCSILMFFSARGSAAEHWAIIFSRSQPLDGSLLQ